MSGDLTRTSTTSMRTSLPAYQVESKSSDASYGKENIWINNNSDKYYGYYSAIGEYRAALNAFATWICGRGYQAETARDQAILERINGNGKDTFQTILWNMIVVKKLTGNSYAQIIRTEDGTLLNLKVLNPQRVSHVYNDKGILTGFKYNNGSNPEQELSVEEVLFFCNDRVLDEPHGTAITSAVEWAINAMMEAREDSKRILHRSTIRILYVDETDEARINYLTTKYEAAQKNKELLILPVPKEEATFEDLQVPPIEAYQIWLNYLEDKFYKALGVPKVVLGGTAENTEASAKVGVISYEPVWIREDINLEADLWNQLGMRIHINNQPSLMDNMQRDEAANTGQVSMNGGMKYTNG